MDQDHPLADDGTHEDTTVELWPGRRFRLERGRGGGLAAR